MHHMTGMKTNKLVKSGKEQLSFTNEHYEIVDINTFSEMQELVYNIVKSYIEAMSTGNYWYGKYR